MKAHTDVWLGLLRRDSREIDAPSYRRKAIRLALINGTYINAKTVTFGPIQEAWGSVWSVAIFSEEIDGVTLQYFPQTAEPVRLLKNDIFELPAASIDIVMSIDKKAPQPGKN